MGGLGSGRQWSFSAKNTVNDYRTIDIRQWCRAGLLTPGTSFRKEWLRNDEISGTIRIVVTEQYLIFIYRYKNSDKWIDMNYPIDLEWTYCKLGGKRPWFLCPVHNCRRRVAILYGGVIFACRQCYQLVYPSQRENIDDRATRKADRIRERLQWTPGIINRDGLKPKGMHWNTFHRLRFVHDELVDLSLKGTLRFGINPFDL